MKALRACAAAAVVGLAGLVWGDGGKPDAKETADAKQATTLPASVEPFDYPLPALLSEAGKVRLQAERATMQQELFGNAQYDPAKVKAAAAAMHEGAKDTVQDNMRRFAEALAKLNEEFAKGWALYGQGNWSGAARALEPLMQERVGLKAHYQHNTMSPYCYVVTKFVQAECLGRLGNLRDTTISYQIIFEKLPNNLTFGATARMRAIRLYEQTNRAHFAIPIYRAMIAKYADLLVDEEILALTLKRAALAHADAFRLAVRRSAEVAHRLDRGESGDTARTAQADLVAMLNEMLVIEEEEDRPFLEATQTITFGAKTGELKEGNPPTDLSLLPVLDKALIGSDDWGKLRPREKQQLMQLFQETYPQQYREMLNAYFRNLSEAESKETPDGNGT